MQTFREKFEANYVAVREPCSNRKGFKMVYRYCGPWYFWRLTSKQRKRCKLFLGTAGVLNAALYILFSILYAEINMVIYFTVPAALSLIALMFEELGIVQFCFQKEKMTEIDFESIAGKIKVAAPIHAALLAVTILSGIFYLTAKSFTVLSLLVILGYAVCAALSVSIFWKYKSIPYYSEKNPLRRQLEAEAEKDEAEEEKAER